MIVPKLFRWLFFRKNDVQTVFDAIRDTDSIYVEVIGHGNESNERWKNNVQLSNKNLKSFVESNPKDLKYILYGKNRDQTNQIEQSLLDEGFEHIYNVGNLDNLKEIEEQEK